MERLADESDEDTGGTGCANVGGGAEEQCAVFNPAASPHVAIPCVDIMGTVYSVGLNLTDAPENITLRLEANLGLLQPVNMTSSNTACGFYNSETAALRLNCVDVNGTRLWADLNIVPTALPAVYQFDLVDYGSR